MKHINQNNRNERKDATMNEEIRRILARLDELGEGAAKFDAWCRRRLWLWGTSAGKGMRGG